MSLATTTKRLISAYADAEQWKAPHREAMLCRDIEDDIAWGVRLFRGLCEHDAKLQALVINGKVAPDDPALSEIASLYDMWVRAARQRLKFVNTMEKEGFSVEGAEDFQATLEEAECFIENSGFGERLPAIEELIQHARPDNPRPERYGD